MTEEALAWNESSGNKVVASDFLRRPWVNKQSSHNSLLWRFTATAADLLHAASDQIQLSL